MILRTRKPNATPPNATPPIPIKKISTTKKTTKKTVGKKDNTIKNNAAGLTAGEGSDSIKNNAASLTAGGGSDSINNNADGLTAGGGSGEVADRMYSNYINNKNAGLTAGGGSGTINSPINKRVSYDNASDNDDTTNDEKNKKVILGVRVMPTAKKNSKGYMVNGIQLFTKYNDLPYSNIDSVNSWLDNFFKYIKKQGFTIKKTDETDETNETDENSKEHDDITYFVIDPIKYDGDNKGYISTKKSEKINNATRRKDNDILLGGRKKSKKNRKTKKSKRSQKKSQKNH